MTKISVKVGGLSIIGAGIGAGVGDAIGWYWEGAETHYLYAGIGGGIGAVIGYLLDGRIPLSSIKMSRLDEMQGIYHKVLGGLGFVMAAASFTVFLMYGKSAALFGAVFFGLCGLYLIRQR